MRNIVIPSELLSFLPYYCHSFRIIVIPSGLLSFFPNHCHSIRIIVIPSKLLSFLPNYSHFKYLSSWIAPVPSHTRKVRQLPYLRFFISLEKLGHTNFVVAMLSVTNHINNYILVESSSVFSGNTANMNNSLGICKKNKKKFRQVSTNSEKFYQVKVP